MKEEACAGSGKPTWKALVVTATPSIPFSTAYVWEPVRIMERPVIVQIMIVSIKVPNIDTSPCLAGSSTVAVHAAIGALPRPASFEKIPLAIPFCIAIIMAPSAPPAIARRPNALCTISASAAGTAVMCVMIIINDAIT